MKWFGFAIVLLHITNASLEPVATTVQIQNYDGPIYVTPGDNRVITGNQPSHYPTIYNHDNQANNIHNAVLHHQTTCETDCKCVTKQQNCIPIPVNSVPQNVCNPGFYGAQYPDGCFDYTCCRENDVSTPRISETLIPLLRTYLSLAGNSCQSHCCQCGRKHAR